MPLLQPSLSAARPTGDELRYSFDELATLTLRGCVDEHVVVAAFDRSDRIVHWIERKGGLDHSALNFEDLCVLLSDPATQRISIAHNHPSGDPRPSAADIRTTQKMSDFCAETGVKLIEHLIIAGDQSHSIFFKVHE